MIKLGKIDLGLGGEEELRKMASVLVWILGSDRFSLNVGAVKFGFRQDVVRLSNGLLDIWV